MATTIKDSVYKAIDVIVGKRIEDLHLDKTIEATIEQPISLSAKKYRLRYGSGIFDAYAIGEDVYVPNTAVYVLIPENDFNKRKTIIGKANTGSQTNLQEEQNIAAMVSGYGIIGQNILNPINTNRHNLSSCYGDSAILLYDAEQSEDKNYFNIDNEKLKVYLEETKGFIFSGKFKTNFSDTQILRGNEEYGLIFNLALKNGKTSFKNMQERWDVQEPKTAYIIDGETVSLNNYKNIVDNIFEREDNIQIIQQQLYRSQINLQNFAAQLDNLDDSTLELVNLYIKLINELTNYDVDTDGNPITVQGLYQQYQDWFNSSSYAFQEQEYTVYLNTNNMTGNIYHYSEPTYQYTFAEIDPELFVRVNSIYFYCKNFTENLTLVSKGSDIQVSDVSITCIKYLDNINGDYRLDLEYEDIYFDSSASDKDTLTITAKLIYQNKTDVTNYSQIMWFRKNSNITSADIGYSMYAGAGWEHITSDNNTSFNRSPKLVLKAEDNKVYRNQYKVIGMYESGTVVQQEFIIYNEQHKHNIRLVSDSGLTFGEGSGSKKITCLIDEEEIVSNNYNFTWYKELDNGTRYKIKNAEDIETIKNELSNIENTIKDESDNSQNSILNIRADKRAEINTLEGIEWIENTNYIIISSTAVPNRSKTKIICAITTNQGASLGEVDLTLTSGYSANLKNYYIEIINGNQVFQYNEAGIAPSSNIYEDPLIPQTLSCNFYDPNGGVINPLKYTVSWQIPLTNTLINTSDIELSYNPITEQNDLLKTSTCNFVIQNEYNYSATNNQIVCIVEFNDGDGLVSYRQPTNFFFGKIGDDGTNGTDVVAKIDIVSNKYSDLNNEYNNNTVIDELLTLKITEQINTDNELTYDTIWNNGLALNDPILQLQLFRKNNLIDSSEYRKVNWSILNNGLSSKYWRTQNTVDETSGLKQGILLYDITRNNNDKSYTNYVIKAQADLPIDEEKYQTYYNFYPICTDLKHQVPAKEYTSIKYDEYGQRTRAVETKTVYNNYHVGIDRARTLRQVVYNSDGRNPQYDRNLGVGLSFKNVDYPRTIVWEPHGGVVLSNKNNEVFPSFSIGKTVSYIATEDGQIDNIIADLSYNKEQELTAKKQEQIQNVVTIIKSNIQEQLDDLNLQYNSTDEEYDNLINNRIEQWEDFCNQQRDTVNTMFTKLVNLIDNTVENHDWEIEDYLFLDNEQYYGMTGAFEYDIFANYLEQKFRVDDLDVNYTVNLNTLTETEQRLLNLDFVIELEDTEKVEEIRQNFVTLIDVIIVGYQAYKVIYDQKIKTLNDDINQLNNTKLELLNQISNIQNVQSIINTTPLDSGVWNNIKAILFNSSTEYDGLDEILIPIVLSLRAKCDNEILSIVEKYDTQINFLSGIVTDDTDPTYCSITPNEVYNGEYPNQYVKVKIYQGLVDEFDDKLLEHELIVPFHMSLNTYGLASLNAWDGNSIEINEEEGYILAPQIGAGIKHVEDNTFTGVLMGTEKTYDDAAGQEEVGLLGYSHGKRSIFLDASTGNATFGLPETDAADVSNPLTEGRIELRPGGTSSISKWNFDSRSIYRVSTGDEEEAMLQTKAYTKQMSANSLGAPYEDAPQYAHGSIPHTKQGILLSALPAYASFKGRILTEQDQTDKRVNYLNLNTSVREGDTFELQIDPNDSRFFSLYEHSARIYEGYGTCDTLNNYSDIEKYGLTTAEFNSYFDVFLNRTNPNYQSINASSNIVLTQRYLQTIGTTTTQIFRPLAYLYERDGINYWRLVNPVVNQNHVVSKSSPEYAIATLKQYQDWQNDNKKQAVWTYITFIPANNETEIPLKSVYDDNNQLIGLSLLNDKIINEDTKVWHRYKKAGIDSTGKFVSEGVGTGAVGLGLNDIQAFRAGSLFIGANFESNNGNVVQFFLDKLTTSSSAPLFVSSTKDLSNSNSANNNEGMRPIRVYAGRDYEDLSTGIFVGKSAEKNPTKQITKIELSQTGPNDNKIVLSALGTTPSSSHSVLTLNTSSDVAIGSLVHIGNWETSISKNLTVTANGIISINSTNSGQHSITTAGSFVGKFNNNANKITINSKNFILENQISENSVRNKFTLNDSAELYCFQQVKITGGKGNKVGSAAANSVIIHAQNTSNGLLLAASNGTSLAKATEGDTYLRLQPALKNAPARFYLQAGQNSYINSAENIKTNYYGVIVGPNLEVGTNKNANNGNIVAYNIEGHDITASNKISGDGTNIKNTAGWINDKDRESHTYKDKNKKTQWYGFGAHTDVSLTSAGSSASFWVPYITNSNGRPYIREHKISITLPKETSLKGYATQQWVTKQLDNYVTTSQLKSINNTLANLVTHYHKIHIAATNTDITTSGPYKSSR